jgi:hypothetical protein
MKHEKSTYKRRVNNKEKYRRGEWHHRVPDFKLVYCGPKRNLTEDESEKILLTNRVYDSEKEEQQKQSIKTP